LIVKFNYGLLMVFRREVDLFESPSLDKAFLRALVMERKVAPQIYSPQTRSPSNGPSHTGHSNVSLYITLHTSKCIWCTFHKTNSHASVNCQALKNLHTNKNLFAEVTQPDSPEPPEVVSLDNPTEVDPSLILMTTNEPTPLMYPCLHIIVRLSMSWILSSWTMEAKRTSWPKTWSNAPSTPHYSTPDPISSWLGTKGRPSSHCLLVLCGDLCYWPFLGYCGV
jgi:hypothetical protein